MWTNINRELPPKDPSKTFLVRYRNIGLGAQVSKYTIAVISLRRGVWASDCSAMSDYQIRDQWAEWMEVPE